MSGGGEALTKRIALATPLSPEGASSANSG